MSGLIEAFQDSPLFLCYMLVGVVVAAVHMARQRMTQSSKNSGMFDPVVGLLAVMWPILVFAMLLDPSLRGTSKRRAIEPDPDQDDDI